MIWESKYWKADLLKQAAELRRRTTQRRWPEASNARCEQAVMLGFYSIRKLMDSGKLTDAVANSTVSAKSIPCKVPVVHLLNAHRVDEIYDWERPKRQPLRLRFLCNQVIHSYVFFLIFDDEHRLSGFGVSSDKDRCQRAITVPVAEVIRLFIQVGHDHIASARYRFDESKGDYTVLR